MQPVKEITYTSSNGKNTIVASVWLPDGEPHGIVQICHGMSEYVDRYDWFAGKLTEYGFAVCGDDHLGHGRTALSKEDLGYFGPKDGYLYLMEDEHLLRQEMQKRYPGLPYFLFGHSMGSFITRFYVSRHAEGLSGYLCSGTSGHNPALGFGLMLSDIMVHLSGGKKQGKLLNHISFQNYNKKFKPVVTGCEWLTRDAEVCKRYADDEKSGFVFTNSGFRDMFHLLKAVDGQAWSDQIPKDLPIILLSGEMDPVGNFGKGVQEVYGWLKKSDIHDLTLKIYPGARHELHNELGRDDYVSDIAGWMEKRMQKTERANPAFTDHT